MNICKASENYEVQRRLLEEPTQVELVLTFSFIGDLSEFAGEKYGYLRRLARGPRVAAGGGF